MLLCILCGPIVAQTPPAAQGPTPIEEIASSMANPQDGTERNLVTVIIALLILQTALIAGLQHSRVKYKRAKHSLKRSQHALEQRVIERTNELRSINDQHEITEERLRETQSYLQSVVNSMPSILIGVTREGVITHWNAATEQATAVPASSAIGRMLDQVAPDLIVDPQMIHNAIDQAVSQAKEAIRHEYEGQVAYADLIIYPLIGEDVTGAVIRIDDVTTRVRFENMMIQSEKMMSLGELAAGMAHEINNPLSAILHAVQNIYRRTSRGLAANDAAAAQAGITMDQLQSYLETRTIYKFLDSIKEAGERSAHIVTNMLEFSRRSSRQHELVDIESLLDHVLELSQRSFKNLDLGSKPIQVEKDIQPELPWLHCSPVEIQQVILNMLRNAAQALEEDKRPNRSTPVIALRAFADNDVLRIQIADNGPGISDHTREHLFEPFFTTKDVGKGTGLGLSVSYFIITEHHHGQIDVDSTLGQGTTFTISLPLQETA